MLTKPPLFDRRWITARTIGRLDAAEREAERCLTIVSANHCRMRPRRAWAVLPLGYDVEHSIGLLKGYDFEIDVDLDAYVAMNIRNFQERIAQAQMARGELIMAMSDAELDALDHAERDAGHWDGKRFEVDRQLEIYRLDDAKRRPRAAWGYLPLGYSIERTAALLRERPIEREANTELLYSENFGHLQGWLAEVVEDFDDWRIRQMDGIVG